MNFSKYNFLIFLYQFLTPIFGQWMDPTDIAMEPNIVRSDYVYREDFGTIETNSPYTSNSIVHYHIFSKKVCLFQVLVHHY